MGELGFLTPNNRRTATMECIEDGQVLTITYEKLLEVYFQNPQFGYYFMSLTTQRLFENIARLEATIAQYQKAEQARASGERVARGYLSTARPRGRGDPTLPTEKPLIVFRFPLSRE